MHANCDLTNFFRESRIPMEPRVATNQTLGDLSNLDALKFNAYLVSAQGFEPWTY